MKNILIIITCITLSFECSGQQTNIKKDGNFYINPSRNWSEISTLNEGAKSNNKVNEVIEGKSYKIKVTEVDDNKVYFKFWYFNKVKNTDSYKLFNGEKGDKVFNMSLEDFQKMTEPYYDRIDWNVGVFTVPYKIRLDEFNFTANVNLGTSLSGKIRFNRKKENPFALEPLLSIGISGIDLNDNNAEITDQTPTNLLAFSLTGGVLIHITEKINTGLFIGMDKLSQKDQNKVNWKHDGNLWFGVGFNISFSNDENNNASAGSNDK